MIKLVIFDRDGVVNELIFESNKFRSPRSVSEVVINPNINKLMHKLVVAGIDIAVATNQPEISRGLVTQKSLLSINNEILRILGLKFNFFICSHDDIDECFCRKPKPGLLLQIIEKHGVSVSEVIFIGDRTIDRDAASNIGMRFLLFRSESGGGIFELALPNGEALLLSNDRVFDWITKL